MVETIGTMFMGGVVFGAFVAGAAFGLTGMFLFLCRITDAYEDWMRNRRRKRIERERHERWLAVQAEQAEKAAASGKTAV